MADVTSGGTPILVFVPSGPPAPIGAENAHRAPSAPILVFVPSGPPAPIGAEHAHVAPSAPILVLLRGVA